MKGMSIKDKQSGIKGYKRGDMNSPILQVKDYFAGWGGTSKGYQGKYASYIDEEAAKEAGDYNYYPLPEEEETKDTKDTKDTKETKEQPQKQQATSTLDPELLLAATMPIGYMIGKGLTALMNRKSRKKQQAEELAKQEKEVKKQNKKDAAVSHPTTEPPKTADKVVDEGGNVGQFA